ncbi:hypothetical protein ACTFIW_009218 [Dictyostelium discoideum]
MNNPTTKVFKNKFLLNKILGFIKDENESKHNKYSYQEIISVEWMIKNKYASLLKSKVKRSEHLFFFKEIGNPSALELIFKHNELNEDLEFLIELFENYKEYFLPSSNECIQLLIKCDCLTGFKLFFDDDNNNNNYLKDYKESLLNDDYDNLYKLFKLSIINNSFKISNFINDKFKLILNSNFNIDNFWKEILIEFKEYISDTIDENRIFLINSSIDFILNQLKIEQPVKEIPELLNWLYPIEIENINLLQLLQSNYTILKIKNVFNLLEIERKSINCNIVNNENFSLLTLNELDEMKFNENDLTTKIYLFNSYEYNGNIKKLFLNLIPFTEELTEISFFSSLSLRNNFYKDNISFYFKKYQSKFSQFSIDQSIILDFQDILIWNDSLLFPFKNFKYDKILQFQYISIVLKEILKNSSNPKNFTIQQLLDELINFDELELIEFMFNKYKELQEEEIKSIEIQFFSLCKSKSVKVFDYLYNRLPSLPMIPIYYLITYSCKFNLIILNHYKEFYEKQYKQTIESIEEWPNMILTITAYTFIYKNINDFLKHYREVDIWLPLKIADINQPALLYNSFETYKFFVESTPSNKSYRCYFDSNSIGPDYYQIIHWLINSKKSDIESGRCSFGIDPSFSSEPPLLYHYFQGGFKSRLSTLPMFFLFNFSISKLIPLLMELGKRGDFKSFRLIVKRIISFTPENKKEGGNEFLAIKNTLGKIFFKYACQNDRFQLLSSCKKLFSTKQYPKEIIITESQRNGSIELAKFLKDSFNYSYDYEKIENVFLLNYLKKSNQI